MSKKYFILLTSFFLLSSCKPERSNQYLSKLHYEGQPVKNKLLWHTVLDSGITTMPIITKKGMVLILGTENGQIQAFDYPKGNIKWNYFLDSKVTSTYVDEQENIYVGTDNGTLACLGSKDGKVIWENRSFKDTTSINELYIDRNMLYFGKESGVFYALNKDSGNINWSVKTNDKITSGGISSKNLLYFGSHDSNLYAVSKDTGDKKWVFKTEGAIESQPILANGIIYFVSADKNLYAVNSKDSSLVWSYKLNFPTKYSPTININKSMLYLIVDNELITLNLKTGKKIRSLLLKNKLASPLVNLNGFIFATDNNGKLYKIDEIKNEVSWIYNSIDAKATPPLIFNGIANFGNSKGVFYAIGRDENVNGYSKINKIAQTKILNLSGFKQFRDMFNIPSGIKPNSTLKRFYELNKNISSSFAYVNDFIYTVANDTVYSLRTENNDIRWSLILDNEVNSSPFLVNKSLYITDKKGNLHSINTDIKNTNWVFKSRTNNPSSPFSIDNNIYFSAKNKVYSVNNFGKLNWKFSTKNILEVMPVALGDNIYFGDLGGDFYSVDSNGSNNWIFKAKGGVKTESLIVSNKVIFGDSLGYIYCLNKNNGEVIWQKKLDGSIEQTPAINEQKLFVGVDKKIYSFDLNGNLIWQKDLKENITTNLNIVDGLLYFGQNNKLISILTKNGELHWEILKKGNINYTPVVIDGIVYFSANSKVYGVK